MTSCRAHGHLVRGSGRQKTRPAFSLSPLATPPIWGIVVDRWRGETATITTFERNTMTTTITTHEDLLSAIYMSTSHGVTREDTPDGDTTFTNGDKFFAIMEEYDDDGETFWGWTWSAGGYEAHGDGEIMEHWHTGGGQDAAEALLAAVRHLGAIEDNR